MHGVVGGLHVRTRARVEMRHELMTKEIEVDPLLAAAPFRAAEEPAVERARRGQVVNRHGEVEGRE